MSRMIRVDSEVFAMLQQRAKPLVDSPNDVLRRLLKLGTKEKRMRSDSGRDINKRYKLGAHHALYHLDGTFYERLERFPGILADPNGYVRYEDETHFNGDPHLDIQEKVHVRGSLAEHPNYQAFP
jgi:hypothetical protein